MSHSKMFCNCYSFLVFSEGIFTEKMVYSNGKILKYIYIFNKILCHIHWCLITDPSPGTF